ncbi:MAG: tetratricopeptide repeat protein, partial [Chloroflexota bacterium]|nr:tetratricopeptide repeat protein [Chloroflexota bacterium]
IFLGIYYQSYGWVAPGEEMSGLEDEYQLSGERPKLMYVKSPAPQREERLRELLERIKGDDRASYKAFTTPRELGRLVQDDLVLLLTERFARSQVSEVTPAETPPPEPAKSQSVPVPPTPLVGRSQELQELEAMLRRGDVRLVTLFGPGGIGKTRLSIAITQRVCDEFPDGTAFVQLAVAHDPAMVLHAIASELGVVEKGSQDALERLREHLRDKRMLLVLDNFEQVMDAALLVPDLLSAAPGLKILVTSREILRVSAEYVFAVPPLSLPNGVPAPSQALEQYDAVQLFVERARSVKPGFELNASNAQAVAEICRRLDGLPLAIELAAARVKLLPPQAMLARLQKRLAILTGGPRDLPTRQQTLQNTIEWSYDLLDSEQQELFTRLGVFVGGCTVEAVEAVCDPDGTLDLYEGLLALVDKSLLRQDESPDGDPRYVMLLTIREFALAQLEARGEAMAARCRHAEYYLSLAEQTGPHLRGTEQVAWLQRLQAEHDNFTAALNWLLEDAQPELLLRLARALWWFWDSRGYAGEGVHWLDRALELGAAAPADLRARALAASALMASTRGETDRAAAHAEQSLALLRQLGDSRGLADTLIELGWALYRIDYARAEPLFKESRELFRQLGARRDAGRAAIGLGCVAVMSGDPKQARALFEEGLSISRAEGNRQGEAHALYNLGWAALAEGDEPRARALYVDSLRRFTEMGDMHGILIGLEGLAAHAASLHQPERAATLFGAASKLRDDAELPRPHSDQLRYEGYLTTARDEVDAATWRAAEERGHALTQEDAVEYALGALA